MYLITRQRVFSLRLDEMQHFVLMIYNSFGIDDIQVIRLDFSLRFCYNTQRGGDILEKLRYNRTFKSGVATLLFCIILVSSIVVFFVISKQQYDDLVSNMESIEARVVDVDYDFHVRGPNEQKVYVEYDVDGKSYSRELKTDTTISFAAGTLASYSVGDEVSIFYDPQNPEIIAVPRTVKMGYFWLIFAIVSLLFFLFLLVVVIKNRRRLLVTPEEYEKEGEGIKKAKKEKRKAKKEKRMARKEKRKANRQKLLPILKAILILIAALMVGFILFYFFKGVIKGIRN